MVMPQRIAQEASDCRAVLLTHDMEAIWPDSDSVAGFLQNPKLDGSWFLDLTCLTIFK